MRFVRAVLVLSGLLFLAVGAAFLARPVAWAKSLGILLLEPLAVRDFRALYGGLDLGIGCFFLRGVFAVRPADGAGGAGVGRTGACQGGDDT